MRNRSRSENPLPSEQGSQTGQIHEQNRVKNLPVVSIHQILSTNCISNKKFFIEKEFYFIETIIPTKLIINIKTKFKRVFAYFNCTF